MVLEVLADAGLRGTVAVTGVALADGVTIPADVVIVGIGASPNTGWLAAPRSPCTTASAATTAV